MSNNPLEQIYSDGFVDLEFCTQNALFEGQYEPTLYHDKILHFIIKGFKDLRLFHCINTKTVKLTVSAINTIDLPDDYVEYLKIGVVYSNGLVWTFTKNEAISMYKDFSCGVQTNETLPTSTEGVAVGDGVEALKKVNVLYNYTGGNNNQYFRVDTEFNRIHLKNSAVGASVLLEYITTGLNTTNETIVPVMFNDTLVSFALWQMKLRTPRTTPNEIELSRQEWIRNTNKLKRATEGFTKSEFLDVIFKHYKRTLKPTA